MDESALERFFDKYIANDSSKMEEEKTEALTYEEELCISLLPDELLTLFDSRQDKTDETRQTADDKGRAGLDYSSRNFTGAAQVPGAPSSVRPATLMRPVIHATEPQETTPRITNIMSTFNLGCALDLNLIAHKAWNVEFNPKMFIPLIMRICKPRTTALFYKSGKAVITGAKSEEESRVGARRFARIVQKLGFPVSFLNFKIQTISATWSTFPVHLDRLAAAHPLVCSYETELFPALFYSVMPSVTLTIHATGKIILSGVQKTAEIYKVFDTVSPILSSFRLQ